MGRFETVYRTPSRLYIENSPIQIEEGALLKDTINHTIVAQLKFKSMTSKTIVAIKVSFTCWDAFGNLLEEKNEYKYVDLKANCFDSFGQREAITLNDASIRKIEVSYIFVQFSDGSSWQNDNCNWESIPLPQKLTLKKELLDEYKLLTTNKSEYMPDIYKNLWFCSCGSYSLQEYSFCRNCGVNRSIVFEKNSEQILEEKRNSRLYDIAISHMNCATTEEEFITAHNEFYEISPYKDSEKLQIVCNEKAIAAKNNKIYVDALALVEKAEICQKNDEKIQPLEEAITLYDKIQNYKDANEKLIEVKDSLNSVRQTIDDEKERKAEAKKKKVKRAKIIIYSILIAALLITFLIKFGIPMIKYNNAANLVEEKNFDAAVERYTSLGDFKDSSDKVVETKYLKANYLFDSKDYINAKEAFSLVKSYKDSENQIKECVYQQALLDEGKKEYSVAAKLFNEVYRYKDSSDHFKACYQYLFEESYKSKDWESANKYYNGLDKGTISTEKANEVFYNYGKELLQSKQYRDAIIMFNRADNYLDASELCNEAKYLLVKSSNNNDLETYNYLNQLAEIGYKDSSTLLKEKFAWRATLVINDSKSDENTSEDYLTRFDNIYCHVKLQGGPPSSSVKLKYTYKWPGSYEDSGSWDFDWSDGYSGYFYTYLYTPGNAPQGTFTANVYLEDGTLLASKSVSIR